MDRKPTKQTVQFKELPDILYGNKQTNKCILIENLFLFFLFPTNGNITFGKFHCFTLKKIKT
ncbi:unnamed protein product [Heterobilharzia americana]|nr:unnamed protein product [Heterobilharzia americana]